MTGRHRATLWGFGLLGFGWAWTRAFPDGVLSWAALAFIAVGAVILIAAVWSEFV